MTGINDRPLFKAAPLSIGSTPTAAGRQEAASTASVTGNPELAAKTTFGQAPAVMPGAVGLATQFSVEASIQQFVNSDFGREIDNLPPSLANSNAFANLFSAAALDRELGVVTIKGV